MFCAMCSGLSAPAMIVEIAGLDSSHAEEIFRALTDDGYRPMRLASGAVLE